MDKPRILIVDDEQSSRRSLSLILRQKGYDTDTAETGGEALSKAQEGAFDLVILEIRLPDVSGTELIAPLQGIHPDIATIMTSGYGTHEDAVQALNQGASAYVNKPINLVELVAVIERIFEKRRLEVENQKLHEETLQELARRVEAEETTRESEARSQAIFDAQPDLIYRIAVDGTYLDYRAGDVSDLAAPPQDIIGSNINNILPADRAEETMRHMRHAIESGAIEEFGFQLTTAEGVKYFDSRMKASGPDEVVVTVRNITENMLAATQLEESRSRFEGILEIAEDAIISIGEDLTITMFNLGAERIFGYLPEEVLGQPLAMLLPERYRDRHEEHVAAFSESSDTTKGMMSRGDISGLRKDGTEFPAEASISKLELPAGTVYTVMLRDISERKRLEDAQWLQNEQLQALANIAAILAGPYSLEDKQNAALAELAEVLQADIVTLRRVNDAGTELELLGWSSPHDDDYQPQQYLDSQFQLIFQALSSGETTVENEYVTRPEASQFVIDAGMNSVVFQPVGSYGIITALTSAADHFTEERIQVIRAIGSGMGVLLENATLRESERQRNEDLDALVSTSLLLSKSGGSTEKYQELSDEIVRIAQADWAILRSFNPESEALELLGDARMLDYQVSPILPRHRRVPYQALLQSEPLVINDYAGYSDADTDWLKIGARSVIWLPLGLGESNTGLLSVASKFQNHFTPDRIRVLSAVANGIGGFLENSRLQEVDRRRNKQLEAMASIANTLAAPEDLAYKLSHVLEEILRVLEADNAILRKVDPSSSNLLLTASAASTRSTYQPPDSMPIDDALASQAYSLGKAILVNDYPAHPQALPKEKRQGTKSLFMMPIKTRDRLVAILNVLSLETDHFTPERVQILTGITDRLGVFLENAELYEQITAELEQRQKTEEQLRQQTEDLETLLGFARVATGSGTLGEKLSSELEALRTISGTEWVILRVPDPGTGGMLIVTQVGDGNPQSRPAVLTEGVVMEAFRSGRVIVTNDYPSSALHETTAVARGAQSTMALPIKIGGSILAVVVFISKQRDHFTSELASRLTGLVEGIGAIMENARLQELEKQRSQDLNVLFTIGQALNQPGAFGEKCQQIVGELCSVTGADVTIIRVLNEATGDLELLASANDLGLPVAQTLPRELTTQYDMIGQKGPMVSNDYANHPTANPGWIEQGIKSMFWHILETSSGTNGSMNLGSLEAGYFTPERVRLLTTVAQSLGTMLENARLDEQVRLELEQRQRTEEQLRRQTEDLETLLGFARAASGPGSLEEKLTGVLVALQGISDTDSVVLRVPEPGNAGILLVAQSGEQDLQRRPRVLSQGLGLEAIKSGNPVVTNDYLSSPHRDKSAWALGTRSVLALPVKIEEDPLAVVILISRQLDHFNPELVSRLTGLVEGIGAILENARLSNELVLIEELQQRRDTFVSVASHELRTPMTSIMGFSELLLTREATPAQQADWLGRINRESKRLTGIIDDLLDVSRIQSGTIFVVSEPVVVGQAIMDSVEYARSVSESLQITVDIPADLPLVMADQDKLGQIMTNLLSNAVKYSPEGQPIRIGAQANPDEANIVISVADRGIGIAPEDQDQLFTVFHRIRRDETEGIRGSGLGLYIVRELARLMNGEVWLESELGSGSTFFVSLPAADVHEESDLNNGDS